MASVSLPIVNLPLREQRYSCHGCGNCCRDFTVQLRPEDLAKLQSQDWERRLGEPVTIEFRGATFLRQRDDGACIFLMDDGLCRIHKEFGFEAKPIACQLFPFHVIPAAAAGSSGTSRVQMGLNFACQSVLENRGADLGTHGRDLGRMAGELAELRAVTQAGTAPPRLNDRLRADVREVDSITRHVDDWLRRGDLDLSIRLDGLAWITASLARAKLENVRGKRFDDLLDVLFGALPQELEHHPIGEPGKKQKRLLRQAVFMRTEDPRLNEISRRGRLRVVLSQLWRSRRFRTGRGMVPRVGVSWPQHSRFDDVERIGGAREPVGVDSAASSSIVDLLNSGPVDDLMTRWLRATVLGGRAWGAGYYGWPIVAGLQALVLNAACVGWLARLHATGYGRESVNVDDVRAALGRIDRHAGRAKWLGTPIERLRLAYLTREDGVRRLLRRYSLTWRGDADRRTIASKV